VKTNPEIRSLKSATRATGGRELFLQFFSRSRRGTCLAAMLLLFAFHSPAAFVYQTDSEFLTSGDFNGDGRVDALVLDKLTGNARVGFQDASGALVWSAAISTGVDGATALAVGRFSATNREAIAVTSADLNRIHLLDLSSPSNAPAILNPNHPGTTLLVGLDAPLGTPAARSWLTAGASDPGLTLVDLFAFVGDNLASFQDQIAAEGFLSSGSSFRRSAGDATLLAAIRRGSSNDTFLAYAYTNTAAPVLLRSNLSPGAEYVFGNFNNEPYPRLLFYVPGQSNVIVQPLINTGSGFAFGTATVNTFTSAVRQVFYVDEQTNGLVVIRFGDGVVGLRPPAGGGGQLQVTPGLGLGPAGNVVGLTTLGFGKFALLTRGSNTVYSVAAQVFTLTGSNYVLTSSNTLPSVTTPATRGNVWLFQLEPFLSSAAALIGSFNAPSWSSTVSGLPAALSVRVESDGGTSAGLGNPGTNNFGTPPAGTAYVLPNQYRNDISFFGYSPARAPESSVITISPPPGAYGGPIQISFLKQNGADDVFYRTQSNIPWQLYGASFLLTNDATIEYYGQASSGTRARTQYASYTMGRTNTPPEDPSKLPGSDTNAPPVLNTNFLQFSGNGTVFYSRHSALADSLGFLGPTPYLSIADSPFNAAGFDYFYLEDFEDGAFNTPGATPSAGWIVAGPGGGADSVDPGGRSYYSGGNRTNLTITFSAAALGGKLPTHAGIVWTDVGNVTSGSFGRGNVLFSARDANGVSLGTNVGVNLGNGSAVPSTAEDRFFGVVYPGGISSITMTMTNSVDWEIDHVQYGYLNNQGFRGSIEAINLDGSGETRITTGSRPRVSRDRMWMSFLRDHDPVPYQYSLWLRNLATGEESRLHSSSNRYVGHDWRPDNSNLVFDNNCFFWSIGLTGPATQLALSSDCRQSAPAINPADGRVAFQVIYPGTNGLYLAPPAVSSRQKLNLNILSPRWPAWSPSGNSIAVADDPNISPLIDAGRNLWVINFGTQTNVYKITDFSDNTNGFPRGAIWAPNGSALVGAGKIGGTNGLWVIPLAPDGSGCHCPPLRLPTSPGDAIDFAGSIIVAPPAPIGVTPGLFIRQDSEAVTVYWSADFEGYVLEGHDNLSVAGEWTPIPGPYFTFGGYYVHRESRLNLANGRFFRLRLTLKTVLRSAQPGISFRVGQTQSVLSWPLSYSNYTLEVTTSLTPPVKWLPLNGTYETTNGMFEFRRKLPDAQQEFYRLRGP